MAKEYTERDYEKYVSTILCWYQGSGYVMSVVVWFCLLTWVWRIVNFIRTKIAIKWTEEGWNDYCIPVYFLLLNLHQPYVIKSLSVLLLDNCMVDCQT